VADDVRTGRTAERRRGRPVGPTRERLLVLLREEHRRTGLWPGIHLAAERLGVSPPTVSAHRRTLIEEGKLPLEAAAPDRARRGQAMLRLPLLPGAPGRRATVGRGDPLDLVDLLTAGDRACFAVVVDDDSMEGPPHLLPPGSVVILRPVGAADEGDVVVARVKSRPAGRRRIVVRQLRHDRDGVAVLHATRPGVADLRPGEFELVGVCISAVRRLGR